MKAGSLKVKHSITCFQPPLECLSIPLEEPFLCSIFLPGFIRATFLWLITQLFLNASLVHPCHAKLNGSNLTMGSRSGSSSTNPTIWSLWLQEVCVNSNSVIMFHLGDSHSCHKKWVCVNVDCYIRCYFLCHATLWSLLGLRGKVSIHFHCRPFLTSATRFAITISRRDSLRGQYWTSNKRPSVIGFFDNVSILVWYNRPNNSTGFSWISKPNPVKNKSIHMQKWNSYKLGERLLRVPKGILCGACMVLDRFTCIPSVSLEFLYASSACFWSFKYA